MNVSFSQVIACADQTADEARDASEHRREHLLCAPPDVARAEDVRPSERAGEAVERVADGLEGKAERRRLLDHPAPEPLDDAVPLEHLEQDLAARNQAHERAQHVDGVALDRPEVDRVASDDEREQREAGHVGRKLGEAVENVVESPRRCTTPVGCGVIVRSSWRRRSAQAPHDRPLLDGVRQLVRDQLASGRRLGREPVPPEEDVVAGGERLRRHLAAERRGIGIRVDAHVREARAEAWLHEAAHRCGQGHAAAQAALNARRDITAARRRGRGAALNHTRFAAQAIDCRRVPPPQHSSAGAAHAQWRGLGHRRVDDDVRRSARLALRRIGRRRHA